jgi:hypothetical protein
MPVSLAQMGSVQRCPSHGEHRCETSRTRRLRSCNHRVKTFHDKRHTTLLETHLRAVLPTHSCNLRKHARVICLSFGVCVYVCMYVCGAAVSVRSASKYVCLYVGMHRRILIAWGGHLTCKIHVTCSDNENVHSICTHVCISGTRKSNEQCQ